MKNASFNNRQLFNRNVEKDADTQSYSRIPGTFTADYFSNKLNQVEGAHFQFNSFGPVRIFGEIELMLYKMVPMPFFEKCR
jgi:hypothetical protein